VKPDERLEEEPVGQITRRRVHLSYRNRLFEGQTDFLFLGRPSPFQRRRDVSRVERGARRGNHRTDDAVAVRSHAGRQTEQADERGDEKRSAKEDF